MSKSRTAASPCLSPEAIRAVHQQDYPTLEQLVTNATVNLLDSSGRSVLSFVVTYGNVAILQWLLTKGPALDQQDRNGWTALHFTAQAYTVEMAALLLAAGATVDVPDVYGNTPLWRAAFESRGRGAMLQLLLAHGANPDQPNDSGVTPRQLAETIANFDVKQLFAQ
ncbi:ankyrin repeat domain-containing protein (plasmid) [Hymenobacter tibetensis]|uniref:Ankyrin repeat domain-containing protein n=1 Tax=Hymenobacter tibetensis TaxID=497967 RepID=A0ABY4DC67_9BACT|nr:ankyrin repeat domain-containing protein [Hymenobacter tibetensis]UOG77678.1 ankyrin repeat domain-containing protein [Hymenobacter tibetensis]